MDVITISRQLGSLGFQIGNGVAERLQYRLIWRDLINQAAIRSGAPEIALAMIDELNILGITPSTQQFNDYKQVVGQVVHEMAAEGGIVIIGRAGQVLLRDDPRAFHVRIIAPVGVRAARISAARSISIEAATAQVESSDRTRRNYLRRFYRANWEDASLYNLVINTGRINVTSAVDLICQAVNLSGISVVDPKTNEVGDS